MTPITILLSTLLPLGLGIAVGGVEVNRLRHFGGIAVILLPVVLFTLRFAFVEPAAEGFWVWWRAGMGMLMPAMLLWLASLAFGYVVTRRKVGRMSA